MHWSFVDNGGSMMSHGFVVDWSCVMAMGSDTMSMCFRKRGEMSILVVHNSLMMDWGFLFSRDQMRRIVVGRGGMMHRHSMVGWGGVVDRRTVMGGGRMVRIGDVGDFLMNDAVFTVMRITDMPHWSMSLGDMMANMRALNMMSLRCFMVCLSSFVLRRLFLLSKHQVMNWLFVMLHGNWLEDNLMLRGFEMP